MQTPGNKLKEEYYLQADVVSVARDLIGKRLCSNIEGKYTAGIITETEAYVGITDRASHSFGGKMTERTKIMYLQGGVAYIYLCYGVHSLFNIVTNLEGIPDAVLVRGIYPERGIEVMKERRGNDISVKKMGSGPGNVSKALGIHYSLSGISLLGSAIWLESDKDINFEGSIQWGSRIGVGYAGKDALLPYRFYITDNQLHI
jgi:DNA-3-methyladenine glycosylase